MDGSPFGSIRQWFLLWFNPARQRVSQDDVRDRTIRQSVVYTTPSCLDFKLSAALASVAHMEQIDCAQDPRVVRTREAVLASARELLVARGWEHVTVGTVAEHSGYARSTLYRQWPNRLDLLREAISEQTRLTHITPSGIMRDDLLSELGAFVKAITTGLGHMVAAMIHMARTDPEWAQLNETVHIEGTSVLRAILARARTDASISRQLDIDDAIDMLVGPIVHRFLFATTTPDSEFVTRIVDGFLNANTK